MKVIFFSLPRPLAVSQSLFPFPFPMLVCVSACVMRPDSGLLFLRTAKPQEDQHAEHKGGHPFDGLAALNRCVFHRPLFLLEIVYELLLRKIHIAPKNIIPKIVPGIRVGVI